jgi:hypothetical protein
MTRRPLPLFILVALLGAAGCSDDSRSALREDAEDVLDDATETAVRNFAAIQGAEQFAAAGHELDDGGLTCTAAVGEGGLEAVEVECTGTTLDGGEAALTGTTSELPGASISELKGSFTATVDGETVFDTDQLGG